MKYFLIGFGIIVSAIVGVVWLVVKEFKKDIVEDQKKTRKFVVKYQAALSSGGIPNLEAIVDRYDMGSNVIEELLYGLTYIRNHTNRDKTLLVPHSNIVSFIITSYEEIV